MACGLESNLKPSSFVIKLHFVDIVIISFVHADEFWTFPPKCPSCYFCDSLSALCMMMAPGINFCNFRI